MAVTEKNQTKPKAEPIKVEAKSNAANAKPQKEIEKVKNPEKTSLAINKKTVEEKNVVAVTEKNQTKPKAEPIKETPSALTKQKENIKKEILITLPAAEIATRKIETIQTVEIKQDSLVLSLFDNGIVDGDTVSVLINGKVIWPRVGLREQATNKTIYLIPEMGDSLFVVMYAENLGSIPPNTGLLVVRDGDINHEIRFSGDLKKNSAIILKRKKKD